MIVETFSSVVLTLPDDPKPRKEAAVAPLSVVELVIPAASIPCCPLALRIKLACDALVCAQVPLLNIYFNSSRSPALNESECIESLQENGATEGVNEHPTVPATLFILSTMLAPVCTTPRFA
jgi:hypothetical protein